MPLLEFEGCRQRIRRAKTHREAIRDLWNQRAAEEDFYSVGVSVNDDGAGSIWLKPNFGRDFTNTISLELGEMLYHLRAALDSCIYNEIPPPCANTGTDFSRCSRLRLSSSNPSKPLFEYPSV